MKSSQKISRRNLLHEKQPKNQPEILRLISDVRKRFLFLRLVSQCFLI